MLFIWVDSESDSESEGDSEGDNLEDTARRYLKRSSKLPKGMIDIKRMRDANFAKPAAGVIQSLQFHPSSNVLLTAGFHKTIDIFQVSVAIIQWILYLKDAGLSRVILCIEVS